MFDNLAPRLSKQLREHLRYAKPMNETKKSEAMRTFIAAIETLGENEATLALATMADRAVDRQN